jgi:bacteriocin biosynthesis cyclodehydratase domain-containing protein
VLADTVHPVVTDDPLLGVPHLFIGAYGERAIIGPLVVPGASSCLRCAYLHTRDADPQWPSLSLQLTARIERLRIRPIDRLLARHAATHAALLARSWVDEPHWTEGWHNQAIEVRLPRGDGQKRERPWHPLCGCSWPGRMSGSAHAG